MSKGVLQYQKGDLGRCRFAAPNTPLATMPYACHFASQPHMTDVFRRKLGVTPRRDWKEVRG